VGNEIVKTLIDLDELSADHTKSKTASVLVNVIPLAALTALVIAGSNFSVGGFGSYYKLELYF
jgi:hypothetical protein